MCCEFVCARAVDDGELFLIVLLVMIWWLNLREVRLHLFWLGRMGLGGAG